MKKLLSTCIMLIPFLACAQGANHPMSFFHDLVGQQWTLQGSSLELSWGVDNNSVMARNYFHTQDSKKKVSEGMWYWHPGDSLIRGTFIAIDMPFQLFEYQATAEENKLLCQLKAYTAGGQMLEYVEVWEKKDGNIYWSLHQHQEGVLVEQMQGTYKKLNGH